MARNSISSRTKSSRMRLLGLGVLLVVIVPPDHRRRDAGHVSGETTALRVVWLVVVTMPSCMHSLLEERSEDRKWWRSRPGLWLGAPIRLVLQKSQLPGPLQGLLDGTNLGGDGLSLCTDPSPLLNARLRVKGLRLITISTASPLPPAAEVRASVSGGRDGQWAMVLWHEEEG